MTLSSQDPRIPDPDADYTGWLDYWAEEYFWKSELLLALRDFLQDRDEKGRVPADPRDLARVMEYLFNDVSNDCELPELLLPSAERDEAIAAAGRLDRLHLHAIFRFVEMHRMHDESEKLRLAAADERRSQVGRQSAKILNAAHEELRPSAVARVVELVRTGEVASKRKAIAQVTRETGYSISALWKHTPSIKERRSTRGPSRAL